MMTCKICGEEFDEFDMVNGMCIDCASSILYTDEIDPDMEDIF